MKRAIGFGLSLLLAALAARGLPAAGDGVEQLNAAFVKALQTGDIDAVMRLYADDAVFFPPGEKAARGLEEIRFKWNSVLNANKVSEPVFEDARYLNSANVSAGWGNLSMRLEPKSGKEPSTIRGRFSTIARKKDGKWQYVFVGITELDEILTLRHYSKTK